MYRKNCEKCNRPSYSSSEQGEWLCPICGNDLTQYSYFDAITLERLFTYKQEKTTINEKLFIVNDYSPVFESRT